MKFGASLFDERGFTIRLFSTETDNKLYEKMVQKGIQITPQSNSCRINNSICNFDKPYDKFKSRALLTIVCGTNEMEHLEEIYRFVQFGKENGYLMEALIEGETYPYETSPLVYVEQDAKSILDTFVF